MAYLWTAREVVEQALRKIGAYGVNDSAAEPNHLDIGLGWLDLIMAELSGVHKVEWLTSSTLTLTLAADQIAYVLADELGASFPTDGISFVTSVKRKDSDGSVYNVQMLRRDQYEALSDPDQSGDVERVYINRATEPTLYVHSVPSAAGDTLEIVVQKFTDDFAQEDPDANLNGEMATGMRPAWQRWAIYRLAADLGDGSVARVPAGDLQLYEGKAALALDQLLAFENREHTSLDNRRVTPWGV